MSEHTPTPWFVSTKKFDDWGWIRGADGAIACVARGGDDKEFDEHRRDGTDPYAANAAFIVKAVNNHDALVKALKESRAALVALMDAVQASQKMNGREYVGLGIQVNDAIGRAWNVLASVSAPGSDANG